MNAFLLDAEMFGFVQVAAALSPPQTLALTVFLSPFQCVFLGLWGRVAWLAHLCLCITLVLNLCTLTLETPQIWEWRHTPLIPEFKANLFYRASFRNQRLFKESLSTNKHLCLRTAVIYVYR